ncbi:MAG: hypothetical protein IJ796_06645 [Lachnospiraceae bacterium]|nr:hypothetical protein [Lachnospiraceae bacterium]
MKGNRKKKGVMPGLIAGAFIAALSVYILLIYTEKKAISREPMVSALVAGSEIKKGESSLADPEKIKQVMIPESLLPEEAVLSEEELKGKMAAGGISRGSVITAKMLESRDEGRQNMKNPVLIGFKAEDYYQTAGGRIKPGDRIHIYLQDEEGSINLRWSNVYVADAFDVSGEPVGFSDEGKTLRYNIYFEKEDVEEFYKNLDAKVIRIALACD